MHIDFKIITWERVEIPEEKEEEVLELLKQGKIQSSNDIFENIEEEWIGLSYDVIAETEQQISIEENKGYSTIQAYGENDAVPVWQNGNPILY
jgi:hypothetical protein